MPLFRKRHSTPKVLIAPEEELSDGVAEPDPTPVSEDWTPGTTTVLVRTPGSVRAISVLVTDEPPTTSVTTVTEVLGLGAAVLLEGCGETSDEVGAGAIVFGVLGPRGDVSVVVDAVDGFAEDGGFDVAWGGGNRSTGSNWSL